MDFSRVNQSGLVLLGCGKMGSAMLQGWLAQGIKPGAVSILDPHPSDWVKTLSEKGVKLNQELPATPAICILAVKPQMMGAALPRVKKLGNGGCIFLSIAAGTPIDLFEKTFGNQTPVIRAMPNTPAAVGHGITALIGNQAITAVDMALAEALLQAVGETVVLDDESQMDAVTAVSGSGPAYVFHLIEALAAAGEGQGLSAELSLKLARATVAGAGDLAEKADETPGQLRVNVTSPGGTTAAALEVLMDEKQGFIPLLEGAVKAAADRSRELGA